MSARGHAESRRAANLRALAEHPGTGEHERELARRMLDRARGTRPQARPAGERPQRGGRHAGSARIAELIAEDLAAARTRAPGTAGTPAVPDPVREAPDGVVFTVESPGPGLIVITIDGVAPGWGWLGGGEVSPRLSALAEAVRAIADGYHRGEPAFFTTVRVGDRTLLW